MNYLDPLLRVAAVALHSYLVLSIVYEIVVSLTLFTLDKMEEPSCRLSQISLTIPTQEG